MGRLNIPTGLGKRKRAGLDAKLYTLEDRVPQPVEGFDEWVGWMAAHSNQVALDKIGQTTISTVFLGLDHGVSEDQPLLFETMVFGGYCHQKQRRYSTWDEAQAGHDAIVASFRES